jgi:5,10-methylenetetrahydromethanopterin reductase
MPIGLAYAGTYPLYEFLQIAEIAEQVDIDSIWLTEEFIYRDPIVLAATLLSATKKLRVIPGPVSPYFKHPVAIARETLSLAEIANGRLALQLGVGDLNGLKLMGVDISRPMITMEESVRTIQALLQGERVNNSGGVWGMRDIKMVLGGQTKIPIYLAAMGRKMLTLARKVADGTVLSHMVSVAYIRQNIELVQALAEAKLCTDHEYFEFFAVSVADDRRTAYNQIRPNVAHWLGVPYPQPVHVEDWTMNGLDIDHMNIYKALQRHDIEGACKLVSDKVLATLSVSGTSKDFEDRLRQYMDAGVTYPVIGPIGDLETKIKTVRLAAKIFGE